MGAAIFPENSKYGGGPEKMAMVAVRQRWRRRRGGERLLSGAAHGPHKLAFLAAP